MKVTATLIVMAAALGARVALAAPVFEQDAGVDVAPELMGRSNEIRQNAPVPPQPPQPQCLPDGWCGASEAGIAGSCCSNYAVNDCCVTARAVKERDRGETFCVAEDNCDSYGKPMEPNYPTYTELTTHVPIPVSTQGPIPGVGNTHFTVHVPIPATLLTPHVPGPTTNVTVHLPVPSSVFSGQHASFQGANTLSMRQQVGPGWHHSVAHHPLPTTLSTKVRERATPPLCVIGGNCSQGPPPEDETTDA